MAIEIDKRSMKMSLIIGDTGTFEFNVTSPYDDDFGIQDGDTIIFTVKKKKTDTDALIKKTITTFDDGYCTVPILPSDTKKMSRGNYVYDLKLYRSDGNIDTLLPNNKETATFILKEGIN